CGRALGGAWANWFDFW
nr:immunoglobulin heavy chain junction region [Macaca mulatta]